MRQVRWQWLGILGVVALVFVGCASSDVAVTPDGNDVAVGDDVPTATTTTVDAAVASEADPADDETAGDDITAAADNSVPPRDPAAPISADSSYDPDAVPKLEWFAPFEPGTYRTGALGTPMSFTAAEALNTQDNGDGTFVVSDVSSRAPDDRDLVFIRVGAFSDPTAPNAPIEGQPLWANDDFRGWLENLHEGVIATEPVEVTVNGLAAIRVDLQLDDHIECGWLPGFCVGFIENNGHGVKALSKGASYRVWIVDQGDEDPLAIVEGIARDEDVAWHERSDAVMDTIAFGDIAPNPVQQLFAGSNSLDALGGVEVSFPEDLAQLTSGRFHLRYPWNGRGFSRIQMPEEPAAIFLSDRPHDVDGNPLTSTEDVVAQLTAAGAELTELEATTIGGIDARVFDMSSPDVGAIMLRFSPLDVNVEYLGWDAPAAGRIWLIEHPDRGLMMISTHAFENVDELLPVVNELGEAIVESLTFSDG